MSKVKTVGKVVGGVVALVVLAAVCLVGYAAATTTERLRFADAVGPSIVASADPDIIELGRYLVQGPAHCSACHNGSAEEPMDPARPERMLALPLGGGYAFKMGPLGTRYARNLTPDPETGLGRYSDAQVARSIRTSVLHDGELSFFMRFASSNLSDEDLTAVLSYLRSVDPVRNAVNPGKWALFGKVLITYAFPPLTPRSVQGPTHVAPSDEPNVARGAYLVDNVMLCTFCHTAFDQNTLEFVGPKGGGGLPEVSSGPGDSGMEFVAPNLTSHPTGVTGRLSEDQFVARLRGGRVFPFSSMPWENFALVTDADLRSVYRYIRTLPGVDADMGPSYREVGWTPGG